MRNIRVLVVLVLALSLWCSPVLAKQAFYGVVEALPPNSYYGVWLVSGRPVEVTPATVLHFKKRPPAPGSWVKVSGIPAHGAFLARKIKTGKPKRF